MDDFGSYLARTADRIDGELEQLLAREEEIPNLHDGVRYALGLDVPDRKKRGKRLRPALCLLTCESLGGDPDRAMPFAAACEMMHKFFLVHDDIEDGDVVRRGRESTWVRFGLDHGINIGDYMFAQTYDLAHRCLDRGVDEDTVLRLVELLSETVERTGEGQTLEMNARSRTDLTRADYLWVVTAKTGRYLAAPLVGGALVAGAPSAVVEALRSLGDRIGPIFQIADDLIDLTGAKGRGERGNDVKEGKRSYLVVDVADRCQEAERETLFRILDTPREETTEEDVQWVLELYERYDAVAAARAAGEELLASARTVLEGLPSPLDANLTAAVEFMLERSW